jgi:hypothetical protein
LPELPLLDEVLLADDVLEDDVLDADEAVDAEVLDAEVLDVDVFEVALLEELAAPPVTEPPVPEAPVAAEEGPPVLADVLPAGPAPEPESPDELDPHALGDAIAKNPSETRRQRVRGIDVLLGSGRVLREGSKVAAVRPSIKPQVPYRCQGGPTTCGRFANVSDPSVPSTLTVSRDFALRRARVITRCMHLPGRVSSSTLGDLLGACAARMSEEGVWSPSIRRARAADRRDPVARPWVTLQLLHLEYLERHPDGYRYTKFCGVYQEWLERRAPTMRQVHVAGDKMFVDYSGKKPHYVEPTTGEVIEVELFVAVLGASSYMVARR